ncbi:MAG: hypothetical protein K6F94_08895 [Bacteroidaceae bacterium]|nr:hypothetical protein [Bacteroidaceae bacterium]
MKKTYLIPANEVHIAEHQLPIATSIVSGGNATKHLSQDAEGDVKEDRLRYNVWDEDWTPEEE